MYVTSAIKNQAITDGNAYIISQASIIDALERKGIYAGTNYNNVGTVKACIATLESITIKSQDNLNYLVSTINSIIKR